MTDVEILIVIAFIAAIQMVINHKVLARIDRVEDETERKVWDEC